MKLLIDARYTRINFHDGISRYTASLLFALKKLQDQGAPELEGVKIAMAVSDERQLKMLPELPFIKMCSPTGPFEPLAALQINKYSPDVVFSPMQTIGSLGRKFKLILTLHDLIYYSNPTPPSFLPLPIQWGWRIFHRSYTPQRLLLNRADAVVTVSNTTAALMKKHRLTQRPIHVIPNAPASTTELRTEHHKNPQKTLLYMGSFMPYKNVETLIKAMEYLPDYTLKLLSRITPARQAELQKIAGKNVEFINGIEDEQYQQLLKNSTALMTASLEEGYGLPVVEAQSSGCPTIISNIPIFQEIAPSALHCNPQNPEKFADAVRTLENPHTRQQLIQRGLEDSRAYSWETSARSLINLATALHEA